jgi:ribosome-binding ATPase YchF (GTP1/OBG family)
MLRAGLIGLPSSGKTTLFELLTSVHEAPRTHGKAEANVGVSRVPDDRLDQLTAMFQPKKRVPATVEFADMAAGRADAKSLVDVVAYRNADALLHVVRAFRDPSVPHPHTTIDPARDVRIVEDELLLADLDRSSAGSIDWKKISRRILRRSSRPSRNYWCAGAPRLKVAGRCARWNCRRPTPNAARFSVSVGQAAAARRESRRGRSRARRRCGRARRPGRVSP